MKVEMSFQNVLSGNDPVVINLFEDCRMEMGLMIFFMCSLIAEGLVRWL